MAILSTFGAMTARGFGWLFQAAGGAAGALYSWGDAAQGQLGSGNTTNRSSPVQIGALTTWSKISVGQLHNLAIKTDGALWAWGYNLSGALGLNDLTNRSSPVQVGALTNWNAVSGGNYHSVAIKT
jgi:alpha-tubulin suppressor-like RCC1 family protein